MIEAPNFRVEIDPGEVELVKRWKAGEHEAFEEIVETHHPYIRSIIGRRIQDFHTGEDVAQKVWINAHRAIGSFSHSHPIKRWLSRIAMNEVTSDHRRRKDARLDFDVQHKSPQADVQKTVEIRIRFEEIINTMRRIVEDDPSKERQMLAVKLKYQDEMDYREIAKILKTSLVNSRVLVSRGLNSIRQSLVKLD